MALLTVLRTLELVECLGLCVSSTVGPPLPPFPSIHTVQARGRARRESAPRLLLSNPSLQVPQLLVEDASCLRSMERLRARHALAPEMVVG